MNMWILISTVFLVNLLYIFLRAFQQQNVIFKKLVLIIPCSVAMAYIEVFIISTISIEGFSHPLVLAIGLGGGIGCLSSIFIHERMRNGTT